MKHTHNLESIGLTKDQAKIYEVLLSTTYLPVRIISSKASVGRELTYTVLKQLEDLDLVQKSTENKIILFKATHPRSVKKIIENKRESLVSAENAYQNSIAEMVSLFSKNHDKPYVRFYEGLEGLQKTYDHILRHTKTIRVFRSIFDYENKDVRSMITTQIKNQSEKKIKSYVLSPHLAHMSSENISFDIEKNIVRKIIPKEKFILPAQIIIYNDTVSITTIEKEVVTTIIENKFIAETFLVLFSYIWDSIE